MLKKQDRVNARNPTDLERKYNLGGVLGNVNDSIKSMVMKINQINQDLLKFTESVNKHTSSQSLHLSDDDRINWDTAADKVNTLVDDLSYVKQGIENLNDEFETLKNKGTTMDTLFDDTPATSGRMTYAADNYDRIDIDYDITLNDATYHRLMTVIDLCRNSHDSYSVTNGAAISYYVDVTLAFDDVDFEMHADTTYIDCGSCQGGSMETGATCVVNKIVGTKYS